MIALLCPQGGQLEMRTEKARFPFSESIKPGKGSAPIQ